MSDGSVPVESILCTDELRRRPSRPPDYEKENRALVALAQALADSPRTVLQALADMLLDVCRAGSAGISLLTADDGKRFYWPAIAGSWKPHIGGGTPRDFGPCGDVLDRNTPLLFRHVERRYVYFQPVRPLVEEALLVPFYVAGKAVGTIWAVAHDDTRKFDAEDERIMISLGRFASSAYQILNSIEELKFEAAKRAKAETRLRLAHRVAGIGAFDWNIKADVNQWSPELEAMYGLPKRTFQGTHSAWLALICPDDRDAVQGAVERAMRDGEFEGEWRVVWPDRSVHWLLGRAFIFKDQAGRPDHVIGVNIDITARKEAQERERAMTAGALAATAKFRAVFEQTTVFAGIMTLEGIVIDANQLSLQACGYRAEDVLGRPFWETGWWQRCEESRIKIRAGTRQAAEGAPYRETLTYHWADGTERLVDFMLHPIHDHEDKIIFLHPTGVDITDLKHAEEKYRRLAATLEEQVLARTEELQNRNREALKQAEQVRELSHRLMQIQDDERRRIARELHDSAGQILTALGMNLAAIAKNARMTAPELAEGADESERLLRQLTQEIRTTSYLLHPPLLDESGLAEALRWYIRGLQERSGLDIALAMQDDFGRLSDDMELAVFRIVQECLTNVHRHSGSKLAAIRIARSADIVELEIRDEGNGIAPEKLARLQSQGAGVGILGMRERVLQLGGAMNIASGEGGTTISMTLPLRQEARSSVPETIARAQPAG
jgi:PAS domain S-box-containing protein